MVAKQSRERIFTAAITLFAERGYRETTVGDIEEAAGLTRRAGGFYRHFTSKEDVLDQAVQRMAKELIAEIGLEEVATLQSPRAELLVIARALIEHATRYRALRLILQRDGQLSPKLKKTAQRANERLATRDVVPWVVDVLKRSGASTKKAREISLVIFGPVISYIFALDRGVPALGLTNDDFLLLWADHWAGWLARGGAD